MAVVVIGEVLSLFVVVCLATPHMLDSTALVVLLPAVLVVVVAKPLESGRERSAFFERLAQTLSLCSLG